MATLSNVNITITATDQTASGVNSALGNVSRLSGGFTGIGKIAGGVFGGILGAQVFSTVTRGIGNVVSNAFKLNSTMDESGRIAESMVKTIANTDPTAKKSFGGAEKAAQQFERTMREIREREGDGLADYAAKIDDIKTKIQEAQQDAKDAVSERIAKEKQQLSDLEAQYKATYKRINENIEDENSSFAERLYDMENSKADKLEDLAERRAEKEESTAEKIADLNADLIDATTDAERNAILEKISLLEQELAEFILKNDAEKAKVIERANHEIAYAKQVHDTKILRLQEEMQEEQAEYAKRKARIEEDAKEDIAKAQKTSKEKIANLEDQLKKEAETHKRFLRDIEQAYADSQAKIDSGGGGGGSGISGSTLKRMNFTFDWNASLKDMDTSEIDAFLAGLQEKYTQVGIKSPFNIGDITEFGKTMVRYTDGSVANMGKLLDIGQALATLKPLQGLHGAAVGLNELLSGGSARSLVSRFELPPDVFAGLDKLAKSPTEMFDLMTERLERVGLGMGIVEARAMAMSGASQNVMETFNVFAAELTKPIYDLLTAGLVNTNKFLAQHETQIKQVADQIQIFVTGAAARFIEFFTILGQQIGTFWSTYGQQIIQWFTDVSNGIQMNVIPALDLLKVIWVTVQKVIEDAVIPGMKRIFDRIAILWQEIAPEVKKTLEFLKLWWVENSDTITNVLKVAWAIIEFLIVGAMETIGFAIKVGLALIRGDWTGVWDAIKSYFGGSVEAIKNLAKGLWDAIGGYFKDGINSVIDKLNGFINSVNKLGEKKIKVGDVEVGGFRLPTIPRLAMGGIVTGPTVAMIGEAGPEAIIPLGKRNSGFGGGINIYVTGNEIMDEQSARRLADIIGISVADNLRLQGNYI